VDGTARRAGRGTGLGTPVAGRWRRSPVTVLLDVLPPGFIVVSVGTVFVGTVFVGTVAVLAESVVGRLVIEHGERTGILDRRDGDGVEVDRTVGVTSAQEVRVGCGAGVARPIATIHRPALRWAERY
jgi:hypothetical protein